MPVIIIFLALLNAVIALVLAQVEMSLGIDIFNFYLIPITNILLGSIISVLFFSMLRKRQIQLTKVYYLATVVCLLLAYFGTKYYIYSNTYVDNQMNINYNGYGVHISEFYNESTGNKLNFTEYYFALSSNKGINSMMVGVLMDPMIGFILELSNIIVLIIMPTLIYKKSKPSFKYCKACKMYMKEKQVFIFNLGDNHAESMLEKIDKSMKEEDGIDSFREVIGNNQELRDENKDFVVGYFNYCDECNKLYLVMIKYMVNKHGIEKRGNSIKEYELDKTYFRLIIR